MNDQEKIIYQNIFNYIHTLKNEKLESYLNENSINLNYLFKQESYIPMTPLMYTIYKDNIKAFKILLKYDNDLNAFDSDGDTISHYIFACSLSKHFLQLFILLLNYAKDNDKIINFNYKNEIGYTILHLICDSNLEFTDENRVKILKLLL